MVCKIEAIVNCIIYRIIANCRRMTWICECGLSNSCY